MFVVADLHERRHKLQAAKDGWAGYAAYLQGNPKAKGFPPPRGAHQAHRPAHEGRGRLRQVRSAIAKRLAEKGPRRSRTPKKDKLNR